MGPRRFFGDFLGVQKVTQPVKSVGPQNRHSFIILANPHSFSGCPKRYFLNRINWIDRIYDLRKSF
ncbi:MAG TPA: hypothetical protein DDW65_10930 [Firmicutes bacterium]|nr:hypothetical protein [Bacillota bacterium]